MDAGLAFGNGGRGYMIGMFVDWSCMPRQTKRASAESHILDIYLFRQHFLLELEALGVPVILLHYLRYLVAQ